MSFVDAIDEALDEREGDKARVSLGPKHAEIEVGDVDRLGVRVRRVRVSRGAEIDVREAAATLPDRMRTLHEPVIPIEVDGANGRAILRTDPDEMRRREFFEVDVHGSGDIDVKRLKVRDDGERDDIDWTLTREQLGRLLDEIANGDG